MAENRSWRWWLLAAILTLSIPPLGILAFDELARYREAGRPVDADFEAAVVQAGGLLLINPSSGHRKEVRGYRSCGKGSYTAKTSSDGDVLKLHFVYHPTGVRRTSQCQYDPSGEVQGPDTYHLDLDGPPPLQVKVANGREHRVVDPARGPHLNLAGWERNGSGGGDSSPATWRDHWANADGEHVTVAYPTAFVDDQDGDWLKSGDLGEDHHFDMSKPVTTFPVRLANLTLRARVASVGPGLQHVEVTTPDRRVVMRLYVDGLHAARTEQLVGSIRLR